jgi:hypothetical protein
MQAPEQSLRAKTHEFNAHPFTQRVVNGKTMTVVSHVQNDVAIALLTAYVDSTAGRVPNGVADGLLCDLLQGMRREAVLDAQLRRPLQSASNPAGPFRHCELPLQ